MYIYPYIFIISLFLLHATLIIYIPYKVINANMADISSSIPCQTFRNMETTLKYNYKK